MSEKCCSTSVYTPAVAELVAIGAAVGCNCDPCFKYHLDRARKLGVSDKDIALAVAMANAVKEAPARAMLELAEKSLGMVGCAQEAGAPPKGACHAPKETKKTSCCG
jgi:AhpD family alkylhydroperoxidase